MAWELGLTPAYPCTCKLKMVWVQTEVRLCSWMFARTSVDNGICATIGEAKEGYDCT